MFLCMLEVGDRVRVSNQLTKWKKKKFSNCIKERWSREIGEVKKVLRREKSMHPRYKIKWMGNYVGWYSWIHLMKIDLGKMNEYNKWIERSKSEEFVGDESEGVDKAVDEHIVDESVVDESVVDVSIVEESVEKEIDDIDVVDEEKEEEGMLLKRRMLD